MIPSSIFKWNAVCVLAAALAFAGCAGDTTTGESSGSLSLGLELEGGVEINEVAWTISGGDMEDMSDTIDTSAPGATASVEVFGLPATIGPDYTITMEAKAEDGTTCKGEEKFGIDVGKVTDIMVFLNCKRPTTLGAVRVNGEFNICAELAKVVVSPLRTSVGNDIDLSAIGQDVEEDEIEYLWTGSGGSVDDPKADETTFTCLDVGKQFVRVTVSDDGFGYCMHSWEVEVTCVEGDGLECIENEDCLEGEVCLENKCVPDLECIENEDCLEGEVCLENKCVPDLECIEDDDCDEGEVCNLDNECVPDVECNENADCGLDQVCIANACYGDPELFCNENLCAIDDDARAACVGAFILCVEEEPVNEEGCAVLARLQCNECNEDSDCDAGEVCSDDKICVPAPLDCEYIQDFEDLVQSDPLALNDDGWLAFGNVFNPDGTGPIDGYFVSPTPNGGAGFAAIADGQGGPDQGQQQLTIYSDYNNGGAQEAGNRVEANTFRERVITMEDVGKTLTFSFDARRGNINDETTENCMVTPNAPCDSTAAGFIKTLDPTNNFFTTNFITEDTSDLPGGWGNRRFSIELDITAGLVGQILQYGFSATAQNFEPSGNFYDNVTACLSEDNGGGGGDIAINGGFETGAFNDGTENASWQQFPGGGTQSIVTDNPSEGTYAANLNIPVRVEGDPGVDNLIKNANLEAGNLTPGQAITITWDMRGSLSGDGGVVFVELFSEFSGGGATNEIYTGGPIFPTADWQSFVWETTLGADVAGGVSLQLKAGCGAVVGCGADVYFDNVTIVVP